VSADTLRPRPFVWPSWIKRLLSGEDHCWWKAWYKAHYKYEKLPDGTNFKEWNEKHDAIVARRAQQFRDRGWDVMVEEEATFKLAGVAGDLQGKPDIVATHNGAVAIVSDAKSGKPRESDHWQVLIYLFAIPMTILKGYKDVQGEVEYPDRTVSVRLLGPVEVDRIAETMRTVTGDAVPTTTPSEFECRYCDVASCKDRVEPGDGKKYF